ncbi:MAG: outer membrane beta-barrel protein [Permianibacter sp.]
MRSLLSVLTITLAAAGFADNALAADPLTGRPVKEDSLYQHRSVFFVNFGVQNGGDELLALNDAESGEQVDSSRAGGYTRLTVGGEIAIGDTPFSVQIGAGLLRDGLTSNVDSSKSVFKRKVLEVIPFWNFDRHRLGVGAAAHLEPTFYFNPDGPGSFSEEFDDAVGLVVQYDIRYDQNISVGARYTYINYESAEEGASDEEIRGNSVGLHVTYAF